MAGSLPSQSLLPAKGSVTGQTARSLVAQPLWDLTLLQDHLAFPQEMSLMTYLAHWLRCDPLVVSLLSLLRSSHQDYENTRERILFSLKGRHHSIWATLKDEAMEKALPMLKVMENVSFYPSHSSRI